MDLPEGTPPGWYPDPLNPELQRYWDGRSWTLHTGPAKRRRGSRRTEKRRLLREPGHGGEAEPLPTPAVATPPPADDPPAAPEAREADRAAPPDRAFPEEADDEQEPPPEDVPPPTRPTHDAPPPFSEVPADPSPPDRPPEKAPDRGRGLPMGRRRPAPWSPTGEPPPSWTPFGTHAAFPAVPGKEAQPDAPEDKSLEAEPRAPEEDLFTTPEEEARETPHEEPGAEAAPPPPAEPAPPSDSEEPEAAPILEPDAAPRPPWMGPDTTPAEPGSRPEQRPLESASPSGTAPRRRSSRAAWLAVPLLALGAVGGYALREFSVDDTQDVPEPAGDRLGIVKRDLRRATRELRSARRQLERGRLSIPTISGSGPREIGTVSLPIDGAVEWSATGGFLLTTPRAILIDSAKGRGRRVLKAGDYRLEVLSRGPWSLRITPK